MNSLNSILLEGNLTQDPELAATPKGTSVCNFRIASNRFYRQDDEMQKDVYFFDVESWARLAERCAEHLTKGRGVRVMGRLRQDRWTDAEGNPHSRIKVVAEHVEFKPQFRSKEEQREDTAEIEAEVVEEVNGGAGHESEQQPEPVEAAL